MGLARKSMVDQHKWVWGFDFFEREDPKGRVLASCFLLDLIKREKESWAQSASNYMSTLGVSPCFHSSHPTTSPLFINPSSQQKWKWGWSMRRPLMTASGDGPATAS